MHPSFMETQLEEPTSKFPGQLPGRVTVSAVLWGKNTAVVWATVDTDSTFSVVSNSTSVYAKVTLGCIQH